MDSGANILAENLRKWLDRDEAERDLAEYFAEPHHLRAGHSVYSGRFFERLDGGGDRLPVCDWFTASDLVAAKMLSVEVPPETAIAILHAELGHSLSRRLRRIPTDVSLGDPEAFEHLVHDSPADEAWQLLNRESGAGYVTAGKLMARKRPHLIPVYDGVVKCALEEPDDLWLQLHAALADSSNGVRNRLVELRAARCVPTEVSELRVLDVVVWKAHRRRHRRQGCLAPGMADLAN